MGWTAATPGKDPTARTESVGRPAAAVVVAMTSAPLVSWAWTRDCAAYVALNTAVETANEPVSAMIVSPRERSRDWRDIDAATTPESPCASGRANRASARRPRDSAPVATRQAKRAAPIQRNSGARKVT